MSGTPYWMNTVAGLADENGDVVEAYDYDAYGLLHAYAPQGDVADADRDGDVDVSDFECLQRCYSGSGQAIDPACSADEIAQLDTDADGDIDEADMALFLDCWQGPSWGIAASGDYDADGWITPDDVAAFVACLDTPVPQCNNFDFDADGELTGTDYGILLGLVGQPAGTLWSGCVTQLAGSDVGNPYFFTGRRLDQIPVSTATEPMQLYHYRARTYDPVHGRFLQRDPAGYVDGANLYEYVESRPSELVDPYGKWGYEIHYGLTLELAQGAGIACAELIARRANKPDEDERDAPSSFIRAAELDASAAAAKINENLEMASDFEARAKLILARAAEWHFPVSDDGVVYPDSDAAKRKVLEGIRLCDVRKFGEGLHVFQDSWAHQGRPYIGGVGHARGAELEIYFVDEGYFYGNPPKWRYRREKSRWVPITGMAAALSESADDPKIWPKDARETGRRTYELMLDFKADCPCACLNDGGHAGAPTSSRDALDPEHVSSWLQSRFRGENKVDVRVGR